MTQIFLGYPPEHIKNWIIDHSKPAGNPKTKITFANGNVEEYDWSGRINQQTMIDAGLYDADNWQWIKEPQTVEIGANVTIIGEYAFSGCSGLTSATIPSSVTSIGNEAFTHCSSLMSVTILEGVTSIGERVFESCSSLTSATIPSSVTSIGFGAFGDCSRLTSVTIPEGVTSIGDYAFSGCSGLTSATIPSSVTSIGNSAFSGCDGLKNVTFSGKNKAMVQGMANYSWGLNSGCTIHCTDGNITL